TRLSAIDVTALGNEGRPTRRIGCDLLAMSGGWDPVVHLFSQSQGKLGWNDKELCRVPGHFAQPQSVVGSANGTFSMSGCFAEGAAAGAQAGAAAGFVVTKSQALPVTEDMAGAPPQAMPVAAMRAQRPGKAFVDF